ncbi:MAG: methyltransferase domain-containing protein [Rhodospirillales bacterium]|nr:methyltransferase domain-containing protein [Rhodospirillales bacterium]
MWTDVVDLRDFYATGLGRTARRMIARRIRQLWPDLSGRNVLGLGYVTPFLGGFRGEAERVIAIMPAAQGVIHWPPDEPGLTALGDHTDLPLPDNSIDRALIVHALECAERTGPMMREVWRVLSDGGRLLVVVPNRRGVWARFERTPFGHGRPYSSGQLSRSLRDAMFTPYQSGTALYVPPVGSRMILSSASAWEEIGQRWFTTFAGVVMLEATKQIYAAPPAAALARKPAYVGIAVH